MFEIPSTVLAWVVFDSCAYKLAAFDFDGTLADSLPWFLGTLNQIADRHGFRNVSDGEIEMLRHRSSREIVQYLGIKPWRMPFLARDFRQRSAAAAAAGAIALFPGIADVLADLVAAGIIVAVVSSNGEDTIRRVLGPSAAHVSHFACSASVFGKARHFRRLIRHTRIPPPSILSIGDEVRDIEAARSVGIATAAVTWGCAREDVLRGAAPDAVFHSVEELKGALINPTPVLEPKPTP
ncbi:MAG: HAD-IA family hydrolase [Prosthecobacter sp.]